MPGDNNIQNRQQNGLKREEEPQEEVGLLDVLKRMSYGIMFNPSQGKVDFRVEDAESETSLAISFGSGSLKSQSDRQKGKSGSRKPKRNE